ncbi:MAG TPA: methyltransferase domain-containing protein [Bryobacteraceae bacterium]|nr:methyltransferase domain-containing protein [Bryobacteraceae bacterium]
MHLISCLARSCFALAAVAAVCLGQTPKGADKLAPYFPTPPSVVDKMLQLGGLGKGEKMFDLGSGDGRIVIMAARKFGADATGVEIDESLAKQSTAEIARLGLSSRARIIQGDVLAQDYSSADLLTVYLLTDSNTKIRPLLEKQLRKGARVVAHDFEFSGWTAEKIEHIEDDGEGRSHTLYFYRR